MNRRAFLKSIATFGAAAAVPVAWLQAWKAPEPRVITFKGIPLVFDDDESTFSHRIDRATYEFWRNQQVAMKK